MKVGYVCQYHLINMLFHIYFVLYELFCGLNLLDMYAFLSVFFFTFKQMALTTPFIIND